MRIHCSEALGQPQDFPNPVPECALVSDGQRARRPVLSRPDAEVGTGHAASPLECAIGFDLVSRPSRRPAHAASRDPIVRLARETPVAYRGIELDGCAIEKQCPTVRR